MQRGPLEGILVVDLTHVLAGPFCTMLLADLGARVVKVERPGKGDDARQTPPFADGQSIYFTSLNRGKESIALDLKAPADRIVFEKLLGRADVAVENFRPGTMNDLGYGWDALHVRHPRLVYAALSGFGQTGPLARRPAYDVVVQAMAGTMSVTGHPDGPPTRVGVSIGDTAAALFTAVAINAALVHRERTGEGTMVDVAMLDSQIALLENPITRHLATGEVPGRVGSRHPVVAPFGAFATADGHIVIAAPTHELFEKTCTVLGKEALFSDPRLATNTLRVANVRLLEAELEEALRARSSREWLAVLEAAGVPCGPINDIPAALAEPQVAARNMVVEAGSGRVVGTPMKVSGMDDARERRPAPQLDGDRQAILRELGF